MFRSITSIMNSVNPNPLRPVGVTTGVIVMPLAINVPPLPSEMPCRISQVAPVTVVFTRLLAETAVIFHHPQSGVTTKSDRQSVGQGNREEICRLGSPLKTSKAPL